MRRADSVNGMVKILFRLDPNAWHGSATESLWATPDGVDRYRLENVPFYAFGVSFEDIVRATPEDGLLVFRGVIQHSGRSTYRILKVRGKEQYFDRYWAPLRDKGCTFEEGMRPLVAVDVPREADIHDVYSLLEQGENAGVWSFEEGHCAHVEPRE